MAEVFNSFINTRERNNQMTNANVVYSVNKALQICTCAREDDEVDFEQELPNEDRIVNFLHNAKSFIMASNSDLISAICSEAESMPINIALNSIVSKLFDKYQNWYFIVTLFAVMEELVKFEFSLAYECDGAEYYSASANSKLVPNLCCVFEGSVNEWIFNNKSWMSLLGSFDFILYETISREILRDMLIVV